MTLAHPTIKDGWFTEVSDESFPGQAFRLRVRQILEVKQSPFQDVLVFESTNYGNVLVLDGIIQATERDEFAYQEMITHLACNSHASPKRVLVIGGGDGGVLREIVKHECVQEAILVEIDETVIRLAKKHLTKMAVGFSHPKVKVVITDGFQYLKENQGQFDVIITDSSDPDGPANSLFGKEYFQLLYNALTPNGVVSTQASENVWLNLSLLKQLKSSLSEVFPNVRYAQAILPTYTSGQLGLMIASRNKAIDLSTPLRTWDPFKERELNRYYSKEIHSASFVVPQFAKKSLA